MLSTIPTSPAALTRPSARTVTEPVAPRQDGPLSVDALRHPVHLAVVAGADAGACLPVTATPVSVGRATAPGTRAGSSAHTRPEHAPLDDPLLSRRHLEVRAAAGGAVVRDAGSTNGSRVCVPRRPGRDGRPRWRRARRLGRRRQFVPFGARIHAGGTVLEVRPRPGADPATGEAPAEAESPTRRRTSTAPPRRRGVDTAMRVVPSLLLLVILVPMLAASGAAPWRWALLVLPLLALGLGLWSLRARPEPAAAPADAASLLLDAVRGGPGGVVPAEVPAELPWHLPGEPVRFLRPGQSLALVGPSAPAAGRWVALRAAAASPPGSVRVEAPADLGLAATGGRTRPGWGAEADPDGIARPAPAGGAGGAGGVRAAAGAHGIAGDRPAGWRITVRPVDPAGTDVPGPPPAPGIAEAVILLARHHRHVPPWCTTVVELPAGPATVPGPAWARTVAALLDRRAHAVAPPPPGRATVGRPATLLDLAAPDLAAALGTDTARAATLLARRWARPRRGLSAVLGTGPDGAVTVDLAAEGPHALVAGTTGSGKSEALLTWILSLALDHSPDRVQFVLVDHKGGAAFAALAGLPHVAGVLTDLDAAGTDRALRSLAAELQRRERVLAGVGARDIADLEAAGRPAPPRLVVVIDEFRVLADLHPGLLDGLRRLAAQGRTLGMHLVLATQRPAGAVGPDLRANLPVRLCLRVLDTADSVDVLGVPDAAHLPARPGAALLHRGDRHPIQVAWCGPPGPGGTTAALVALAADVRRAAGGIAPLRPWADPLPVLVRAAELPVGPDGPGGPVVAAGGPNGAGTPRTGSVVCFGLADLPDEQRTAAARLDLADGGLLVVGDPGTGRTQAARTLLAAALDLGLATHVLTAADSGANPLVAGLGPWRAGTWVGAGDPRRARALLRAVAAGAATPAGRGLDAVGAVLVVDDAEAVADLLDTGAPAGSGADLLTRVVRDARRHGVAVVLTAAPATAAARWTAPLRRRLVLGVRDDTAAAMAGVPAEHRGAADVPGRGTLLGPAGATTVQVALRGSLPPRGSGRAVPRPGVLDLRPLPGRVPVEALRAAARTTPEPFVAAGLGGDDAGPVAAPLDADHPWAVVGPPGSGRSTALRAVEAWCRAQGRVVVRVDGGPPAPGPRVPVPPDGAVLIVDDHTPAAGDPLDQVLGACPGADHPSVSVVVAVEERAVSVHAGGLLARCATVGTQVVLAPHAAGSREVREAADPHRRGPGHAVLVHRGRYTALTVADEATGLSGQRAAGPGGA